MSAPNRSRAVDWPRQSLLLLLTLLVVGAALNGRLKTVLPTGMFFSACLLEWGEGTGRLRLWSGGVPELLLCRQGEGIVRRLDARHLPLGIVAERELDTTVEELTVRGGDRLYLYSDGVIETENGHGEQYGQGRLEGHLSGGGIDGAFDAIRADLAAFRGSAPQLDDVTLLEIVC